MKGKFLLVAAVVALPLASVAVTLEDTVKQVLDTNPIIQEEIKYFRSVKQDVDVAKAGYYPTLDLVAGYGREMTNNNSTLFSDVYLSKREATAILNQNLFEGFATQNNLNRQLSRVDSAAFSVLEDANQVSLSMIEAYTNLFKNKNLLDLAEKNLEAQKNINLKIQDRITSGVGANSELEQSSSRLALAESNVLSAMSKYEDTLSTFIKIYGTNIDPEKLAEPRGVEGLPDSKVLAFSNAKEKNPSLKVQRANIEVARNNYKLTDRSFAPKIDLEIRRDWNRNVSGVEGDDDSASIMLKFRINLYNGGADKAEKQKTVSELHQEMQVYENLNRRVNESISLAWTAYSILEKQIKYITIHKDLSEKTLKSYKEEFDLGRRTLLDILDTEEELYSANREFVTAKYDHIFAQYRILESIGTLSSYFDANFVNVVGLGEEANSQANVKDELPKEL